MADEEHGQVELFGRPEAAVIAKFLEDRQSKSTTRTYRILMSMVTATVGAPPPFTRGHILLWLARGSSCYRPATVATALVAIRRWHSDRGLEDPTRHAIVGAAWRGLCRQFGTAQKQARPVTLPQLRRMIQALDALRDRRSTEGLRLQRDRACLIVGWCSGLRRSELAQLRWTDVEHHAEGILLRLRRSKTDQAGAGRSIGLVAGVSPDLCPVRSLDSWQKSIPGHTGYIFPAIRRRKVMLQCPIGTEAISRMVQRYAELAALGPGPWTAHSLRAGLCTQGILSGVPEIDLQQHVGNGPRAFRRYVREVNVWQRNPLRRLGI